MRNGFRIDLWLLAPVFVLIVISLTTLFSIDTLYFRNQSISLVVAIFAFLIFARIDIDFLKSLKVPIYIVSIILLGIVLVMGIEARGAVRWIEIFGIRLQFSEILKPFLAISFAAFLSDISRSSFRSFLFSFLYLLPIVLLVYFQPDLGSALIFGFTGVFTLFVIGFPFLWFVFLFLPFVFLMPFFWSNLHDYQRQRVLTFLDPQSDPLGTSYNGVQAIIAIGSGLFLGKGLFEGTQSVLRFLPERQTDFIFATIAEGLGFIGAFIVIIAFVFFGFRLFKIYKNSSDIFSKIFVSLTFGFFMIQGLINIAMNMGLLPIVGITLPFVSFGGSSLLSSFIFLGLLSQISASQDTKSTLEIR